jgi:predicted MFS family arabinose efflux permease
MLIFVIGIVLFCTLALLPPYLSQLMHYPVLDIGLLLAPRGMGTMVGMMVVGRLLGRIDARWPIVAGMPMTGASLYFMTKFGVRSPISTWSGSACCRAWAWAWCSCRSPRWPIDAAGRSSAPRRRACSRWCATSVRRSASRR